jgi:hypothetical protein
VAYHFNIDYSSTIKPSDIITIMGVMLSINCASASNLHLRLVSEEERGRKNIYDTTKREIKHNVIFLFISFLLSIITLCIVNLFNGSNGIKYISNGVVLAFFLSQIYAVFEINVRFILNIQPSK